jgi:tRNA threonylcarbamoyladenosine biosynthesis protein TsaE
MARNLEFVCKSIADLDEAAEHLLTSFPKNTIFALYGQMGVGKTTFIQHICTALGVVDDVTSPTFSIINEYSCGDGTKVYHMDFYRINDITEVLDIGYEEYFYSGNLCFIEWPEKIEHLLPEGCVDIIMKEVAADHSRMIKYQAHI